MIDGSATAGSHSTVGRITRRGSGLRARKRHGRLLGGHTGAITLEWVKKELELKVEARPQNQLDDIGNGLLGWGLNPRGILGTWLDAEVLENQGQYGFLLRLIRRGFLTGERGCLDLREFVLRIEKKPIRVIEKERDISNRPDVRESIFAPPMTARRFCDVLRASRNLTVNLSGTLLLVQAVYHARRLHVLGADHPDNPANEKRGAP